MGVDEVVEATHGRKQKHACHVPALGLIAQVYPDRWLMGQVSNKGERTGTVVLAASEPQSIVCEQIGAAGV